MVSASDEEYLTAPVPSPEDFHMLAEWDTGATESAISKGLVDFLGLKSTGTKANLFGGNGIYQADTYRINLYFEDGIVFKNLTVSEMPNNPSLTVLVGSTLSFSPILPSFLPVILSICILDTRRKGIVSLTLNLSQ